MKKFFAVVILMTVMMAVNAFSQDNMIIRFKNGSSQIIDMSSVDRIEFGNAAAPSYGTPAASGCWTGHFAGSDISGYGMDINLQEQSGTVTGGYSYYHKAQGKQVRAVILDATVQGDTLRGRWKQVEGVSAEGQFEWRWLSGEKCMAFEGTFDGTRYWQRMTKR